jgi:putative addiction module killer protein
MYDIETTDEFDKWLKSIPDGRYQKAIVKRIRSMSLGLLGKTKSLMGGLFEAKIEVGPGFRLYFANKGKQTIVLLRGGDKSTQEKDIERAQNMVKEM